MEKIVIINYFQLLSYFIFKYENYIFIFYIMEVKVKIYNIIIYAKRYLFKLI